jgi:hypothetical protein
VKGGSGASAEFQSLVKRSITVWNSVNSVGVDQTDYVCKNIKMLRSLSSMEALLDNGQFWFFQLRVLHLATVFDEVASSPLGQIHSPPN